MAPFGTSWQPEARQPTSGEGSRNQQTRLPLQATPSKSTNPRSASPPVSQISPTYFLRARPTTLTLFLSFALLFRLHFTNLAKSRRLHRRPLLTALAANPGFRILLPQPLVPLAPLHTVRNLKACTHPPCVRLSASTVSGLLGACRHRRHRDYRSLYGC